MTNAPQPDWIIRAEKALAKAMALPPGSERIAALREAGELRNAALNRELAIPNVNKKNGSAS